MNVRELIAVLQELPDQEMTVAVMHACSGMDAAFEVRKAQVVTCNSESDAMHKDSGNCFPRVEITGG